MPKPTQAISEKVVQYRIAGLSYADIAKATGVAVRACRKIVEDFVNRGDGDASSDSPEAVRVLAISRISDDVARLRVQAGIGTQHTKPELVGAYLSAHDRLVKLQEMAAADAFARTKRGRVVRRNKRGFLVPVHYEYVPKVPGETARRKAAFLKLLAETGSVSVAAVGIKAARSTVFGWRNSDKEFGAAWEDIWESKIDALETSMMKRATDGYRRPVYQGGKLVGYETVHVPQLSVFMLSKSRIKYAEQMVGATDVDDREAAIRQAADSMGRMFRVAGAPGA